MTLPCAARISIPFRCTYVLNFGCFWRPNDATTSPSLGQLSWPFKRATPSPADRGRSEAAARRREFPEEPLDAQRGLFQLANGPFIDSLLAPYPRQEPVLLGTLFSNRRQLGGGRPMESLELPADLQQIRLRRCEPRVIDARALEQLVFPPRDPTQRRGPGQQVIVPARRKQKLQLPVRPLLVHHPQPAADRALPLGDLLPETLERGVRVRDFTVLLPELGVHRGQVLAPKPDPVVRLLDLLQHRGFFALGFLRFLFLLFDLPFQFFQRLALFLDLLGERLIAFGRRSQHRHVRREHSQHGQRRDPHQLLVPRSWSKETTLPRHPSMIPSSRNATVTRSGKNTSPRPMPQKVSLRASLASATPNRLRKRTSEHSAPAPPNSAPSSTNGVLMKAVVAPISFMISISSRRACSVNRIVLARIVTMDAASTAPMPRPRTFKDRSATATFSIQS